MLDTKLAGLISDQLGVNFFTALLLVSLIFGLIKFIHFYIKKYIEDLENKVNDKADFGMVDRRFKATKEAFERTESECDIKYVELKEKTRELKTLREEDSKKLMVLENKILEHEIETNSKIKSIEASLAIIHPMLIKMSEQLNQILGRMSEQDKRKND